MTILRFYVTPAHSEWQNKSIAKRLAEALDAGEQINFRGFSCEACFHVVLEPGIKSLQQHEEGRLAWLLSKPISVGNAAVSNHSYFGNIGNKDSNKVLLEYGPRLSFTTPFSTNAVAACHAAGLTSVVRLERSYRFLICVDGMEKEELIRKVENILHDRMVECRYVEPPNSFTLDIKPDPPFMIDVLGRGLDALKDANEKLGLAFDSDDMDYYLQLFRTSIKRNPTNVELFDLSQSNSEHSRHWFFKGRMVMDGKEEPSSLMQMVMDTQNHSNSNNVIKFCDNSSAIEGFTAEFLSLEEPSGTSTFVRGTSKRHILYTAETHNFPTGVCPFPGAATGTGGRIRDVQAAGRGGHVVAGVAGYCFGNLNVPGYTLPWEDQSEMYPRSFASPLDVCIQASNGASDYGNKFGEPVICGFARSFGMRFNKGERVEWVKPIMFSGGVGSIDDIFLEKESPQEGMDVVKLGGPVYRIGVGGGSASSVHIQGDQNRSEELDYGAVQRGDPEMEHKLNRVIRACIEMGQSNPIASIHDQGAGGNANVLKEIVEGAGAVIHADKFELGDNTISILELWAAEYQESDAILARREHRPLLEAVCKRERCRCCFVGQVTSDNMIVVKDFTSHKHGDSTNPVELPLDKVLASIPPKIFHLNTVPPQNVPLRLPPGLTVAEALNRVLRLPAVASKRYLTNKVDRSVTGLVAQQQCVGPLHTPVADVAVVALSYFDTVGSAVAIGEQPIKGLVEPGCGARMAVAEALTNLVFAPITCLKDVKCSANWMWAAKLSGEGAKLLTACKAMCTLMNDLGIAVDGGKDSLSMAARVGDEIVKAPGSLVISAYAPCVDITRVVTPDLKCPGGEGALIYVRFGSMEFHRLGGSALAQCYGQTGDTSPDISDAKIVSNAFNVTQDLIKGDHVSSGHDVSDGGLVTTVLEMAFAGNCSINIDLPNDLFGQWNPIEVLFSEEAGIVLEAKQSEVKYVLDAYKAQSVPCAVIGSSQKQAGPPFKVNLTVCGKSVLGTSSSSGDSKMDNNLATLRSVWEETSFELEKLQCNEQCAVQEHELMKNYEGPKFSSTVATSGPQKPLAGKAPAVAVIREEGSNGDREMAAAFSLAGFEVWDVCMQDFADRRVDTSRFRGMAFVGGFSYADVFGSAKGWASAILSNQHVCEQFESFYFRQDTFSLGVCNGCQLMCLLSWVGTEYPDGPSASFLDVNDSGRYESRFSAVKICQSQSILLKNMVGSTLGVWVSHGEGKFAFADEAIAYRMESAGLVPLRYVDDEDNPTMKYPLNPNGSISGIAGLCSDNGRHLALMPHPERSFLSWQWPHWPEEWERRQDSPASPWLKMFQNAYEWCCAEGKE